MVCRQLLAQTDFLRPEADLTLVGASRSKRARKFARMERKVNRNGPAKLRRLPQELMNWQRFKYINGDGEPKNAIQDGHHSKDERL
jgi:hypothetical protein